MLLSRKLNQTLIGLALAALIIIVLISCFSKWIASSAFSSRSAPPITFSAPDRASAHTLAEAYGELPMGFEPNQGQSDPSVKFLARGAGYNLLLTSTGAVLQLRIENRGSRIGDRGSSRFGPDSIFSSQSSNFDPRSSVMRMKLRGANPAPRAEGLDPLPGKSNYFIGNDRRKWRANVP